MHRLPQGVIDDPELWRENAEPVGLRRSVVVWFEPWVEGLFAR